MIDHQSRSHTQCKQIGEIFMNHQTLFVCSMMALASEAKKYSTASPGLDGEISEVLPAPESTLKVEVGIVMRILSS